MQRVLALNTEGQLTYCTAPEELRGKGRCNHLFHQNKNQSKDDFMQMLSEPKEYGTNQMLDKMIDNYEFETAIKFNYGKQYMLDKVERLEKEAEEEYLKEKADRAARYAEDHDDDDEEDDFAKRMHEEEEEEYEEQYNDQCEESKALKEKIMAMK